MCWMEFSAHLCKRGAGTCVTNLDPAPLLVAVRRPVFPLQPAFHCSPPSSQCSALARCAFRASMCSSSGPALSILAFPHASAGLPEVLEGQEDAGVPPSGTLRVYRPPFEEFEIQSIQVVGAWTLSSRSSGPVKWLPPSRGPLSPCIPPPACRWAPVAHASCLRAGARAS